MLKAIRTRRDIDARCNARRSSGYCKMAEAKYFFDKRTSQCIAKYLGDCSGDEDLFDSKDECERACL